MNTGTFHIVTSQEEPGYGSWKTMHSGAIDAVMFRLTKPAAGKGMIRVKFKRFNSKPSALSNVYEYYDVPEEIFANLVNHRTPATYLSEMVKPNYSYKRLTNEEFENEGRVPEVAETATPHIQDAPVFETFDPSAGMDIGGGFDISVG